MIQNPPYRLTIQVIDTDGNEIITHITDDHSKHGACQAYGHAVAALLKHYKEKREDAEMEASRRAEEEAIAKAGTE